MRTYHHLRVWTHLFKAQVRNGVSVIVHLLRLCRPAKLLKTIQHTHAQQPMCSALKPRQNEYKLHLQHLEHRRRSTQAWRELMCCSPPVLRRHELRDARPYQAGNRAYRWSHVAVEGSLDASCSLQRATLKL